MTDVPDQRSSLIIHCDGSCNNATRKGAWAAIVECPDKNIRKQLVGNEDDTTSSRMELQAVIQPLSKLKNPCKIRVISDSQYVVNPFNKGSIDYWEKHFWTLKIGGQVKNQDLWKKLLELSRKHEVTWQWIKGHDKNTERERWG